jgi:hypothetical protein
MGEGTTEAAYPGSKTESPQTSYVPPQLLISMFLSFISSPRTNPTTCYTLSLIRHVLHSTPRSYHETLAWLDNPRSRPFKQASRRIFRALPTSAPGRVVAFIGESIGILVFIILVFSGVEVGLASSNKEQGDKISTATGHMT